MEIEAVCVYQSLIISNFIVFLYQNYIFSGIDMSFDVIIRRSCCHSSLTLLCSIACHSSLTLLCSIACLYLTQSSLQFYDFALQYSFSLLNTIFMLPSDVCLLNSVSRIGILKMYDLPATVHDTLTGTETISKEQN
jgi:hypothetical protein